MTNERVDALDHGGTPGPDYIPALLELPADHPRPAELTEAQATEAFELAAGPLARLAGELGTSMFSLLLAGLEIVLHRYSGQEHFVVGSPADGRRTGERTVPGQSGAVRVMLLRADVSRDPTVRELISRARDAMTAASEYAGPRPGPPGADPEHDADHNRPPRVQVMLRFRDAMAGTEATPWPGTSLAGFAETTASFDLALSCQRSGDRLRGEVAYSTELFDPPTIRRLIGHLGTVLNAMASDDGLRVREIPLLTEREKLQLLVEWNDTAAAYPAELCIFQLVERQAHRAPASVALVYETEQVSYGDLNARANQLAHHLRAIGAGAGTLVAILAERGTEMIIGLLGILKAGGAYVPLDPEYPAARLSFMLEDSAAPIVLTLDRLADRLPASSAAMIRLDADWSEIGRHPATDPEPLTTPADLAYVTYTSGSTGRPKGVMVEHRSVVSFVTAGSVVRTGPGRVFLQFVPVSFDVSTFEIWGALAHGSRLVIAPAGKPDTARLAQLVRDEGVTTMWLTAPLFHEMVAHHATTIGVVEELVAGGDVVSPAHFAAMLAVPGKRFVINGYGPTEATVLACTFAVPSGDEGWRPADQGQATAARVPIGRPVGNLTAYLLDGHGNPVPVGVTGELCLGGAGVARGYLGRPALTAGRFVPDPFGAVPGGRLYRTGDLARHLPDGTIDFLGRADHQLKIRGFRVEAGEIEAALMAHPAVRECVVVGSGDGSSKRLVGYVVTGGKPPTAHSLRQFVAERLPAYMLPSAFVALDALPLTPNGKVDRSALPEPATGPAETGEPHAGPATGTERLLLPIVADVLQLKNIGVDDDIFELGCDSLQVLRLLAIIGAATGVDLEVADLYDHPTVAGLGNWVTEHTA